MNIQRKNSAHHFRMQSEREQTLVQCAAIEFLVHIHTGAAYIQEVHKAYRVSFRIFCEGGGGQISILKIIGGHHFFFL